MVVWISQIESITLDLRVLTSFHGGRQPPHLGARGQARTRLARRAVVDAARALFAERGYQATTVDAISERADVPPATVYRLFSSKLGILKAMLDVSIAGDDQPLACRNGPRWAGWPRNVTPARSSPASSA